MPVQLPMLKSAPPSEKRLRVGDLARDTGKTVRALHLYEELGLLVPTERSKGGYRLYGSDSIVRVHFISKLQDMGFSLAHIGELVRAWEASASAPSAMARMRKLYRQKLAETREQRLRIEALERELVASVEYLDTCDTCDPHRLIHACAACDIEHCTTHVPELVAGLHQR